ncbi:hypothetical protein B7R22_04285 [Subtercola boreus]|uniref:Uncharacterized protein n=1 Tax=Subtercola boreus TaxID=120213 RepID=A0A3E0W1G9_9MICO|nr:hypothetical protein B7R22_04285 [Subtercola boreus]
MLLALLVGSALGLGGALMQAITRDPLGDPGLLGHPRPRRRGHEGVQRGQRAEHPRRARPARATAGHGRRQVAGAAPSGPSLPARPVPPDPPSGPPGAVGIASSTRRSRPEVAVSLSGTGWIFGAPEARIRLSAGF